MIPVVTLSHSEIKKMRDYASKCKEGTVYELHICCASGIGTNLYINDVTVKTHKVDLTDYSLW